jgi:hypothetical protein
VATSAWRTEMMCCSSAPVPPSQEPPPSWTPPAHLLYRDTVLECLHHQRHPRATPPPNLHPVAGERNTSRAPAMWWSVPSDPALVPDGMCQGGGVGAQVLILLARRAAEVRQDGRGEVSLVLQKGEVIIAGGVAWGLRVD